MPSSKQLLNEFFQDRLIEDFPIKFVATAVNLDTEREIVLSSGKAVDAVLAAIAIPGIFPARKTEKRVAHRWRRFGPNPSRS